MIFRPVSPASPWGAADDELARRVRVEDEAVVDEVSGEDVGERTCSRTSASIWASETPSSCCVESTTVWTRRTVRSSSSYSTVT